MQVQAPSVTTTIAGLIVVGLSAVMIVQEMIALVMIAHVAHNKTLVPKTQDLLMKSMTISAIVKVRVVMAKKRKVGISWVGLKNKHLGPLRRPFSHLLTLPSKSPCKPFSHPYNISQISLKRFT